MPTIQETIKSGIGKLKTQLGVSNSWAVPRITKIVVAVGTGRNRDKNDLIADRLTRITGQKPAPRGAKKSIAAFKLRESDIVGQAVTLRRQRMYDFLDRLINIAIPRIRDFRGFDSKSIDDMGNLTIGIKEHIAFPETADEEARDVFSLAITIVTTAKNRQEAKALFDQLGFPFRKN